MTPIRDLPIRKKIVATIMIVSAAVLLLAGAGLITYDFVTARRDLQTNALTLARIISDNTTAAVSFEDPNAARDTLNSLRAERSIAAACVYTPDGLFAEYAGAGQSPCPETAGLQPAESRYVLVSSPIELEGKQLGTVYLRATLAPVFERLRLEIAAIAGILLFSTLVAFILSYRLQKFISEPILSLARTTNVVSRRQDYSVRAVKQGEDELGKLVDSFNEMLAQIERRDSELEHRAAELLQANRMKDEFLATLSHELRTPLNSILGWAVLLQGGRMPRERERAAVGAIERNARVQARVIEDLLDVSRIVSGKFTLDSSEVGLRAIIETAIEVVRPAAETKQIHLQFQDVPTAVWVRGDAPRLQQAVWNLLSKAVKYTSVGGTVEVRLVQTERHARISVSDNGIGIEAEFLPFVFDRFRQADSSSTRAQGGLGLGLAIVRHIVEMHGGAVSVESRGSDQGATFTIDLPLPLSDSFRDRGEGATRETQTNQTGGSAVGE